MVFRHASGTLSQPTLVAWLLSIFELLMTRLTYQNASRHDRCSYLRHRDDALCLTLWRGRLSSTGRNIFINCLITILVYHFILANVNSINSIFKSPRS
jgi:hypothetical protein